MQPVVDLRCGHVNIIELLAAIVVDGEAIFDHALAGNLTARLLHLATDNVFISILIVGTQAASARVVVELYRVKALVFHAYK